MVQQRRLGASMSAAERMRFWPSQHGDGRTLEGTHLSSTETIETAPLAETDAAATPATSHDTHSGHEDHLHEGHDHAGHSHGPVLNPECVREVRIEATTEEVDAAFARVLKEYKKYAKIPGFRAGKVPETVVKRRFAEQIRKDVVERLLPERFQVAIQSAGLLPVSQPQLTQLTLEEGKPLEGTAVFEVVPPIVIDGYQEVTVPKPEIAVTEEEFQRELKQLLESRATVETVEEDRPLVDGDWAQISFSGVASDHEAGDAEPISGDNSLIEIGGEQTLPAFTEALRGAKPGQEIQAEVIYPADYQEARLAGKTVAYTIEVQAIKKRILPELTDAFAQELGDYENQAALETRIREYLQSTKERDAEQQTREALFARLAERFAFPVPETLVQQQVDARLDRGLRALASQGMSAEMMRKLDFTRLRGAQRETALQEVRSALLLDRIAEAEGIEVSDEEFERELQIAALQSREPLESLRARLTQDGGLARIREQIKREKTASALYQRMPAA